MSRQIFGCRWLQGSRECCICLVHSAEQWAADAPELISVSSPMAANAPVRTDAVWVSVPTQAVPVTVLQPRFVRADN